MTLIGDRRRQPSGRGRKRGTGGGQIGAVALAAPSSSRTTQHEKARSDRPHCSGTGWPTTGKRETIQRGPRSRKIGGAKLQALTEAPARWARWGNSHDLPKDEPLV
eukprot:3875641-Pyramimonas_sp.AAC.1